MLLHESSQELPTEHSLPSQLNTGSPIVSVRPRTSLAEIVLTLLSFFFFFFFLLAISFFPEAQAEKNTLTPTAPATLQGSSREFTETLGVAIAWGHLVRMPQGVPPAKPLPGYLLPADTPQSSDENRGLPQELAPFWLHTKYGWLA